MNPSIKHTTALALLIAVLVTTGFGCKAPSKAVQERTQPVTLEYWRVWDDADSFAGIIADYQTLHPNVKINYRKFRYEEYEQQLLEAFAEDRGPDLFSIPESWLREYQPKLTPMPAKITMATQRIKGTIKKEQVFELETTPTPNLRQIKDKFPDTVVTDSIIDDVVYGLPLSVDSLVMLYNRDLFNAANISQPPATWDEFSNVVTKLTRYDSKGAVVQSGAAIGTGVNINTSADLLSVLMMQNGATMTTPQGSPTFFASKNGQNPGSQALRFYRDFSSPTKNVYSWSTDQPNALDAFMAGKTAIAFAYNYNLPLIRARAPRVQIGIAPLPQISPERPTNLANYWLEVTSKKTKYPNEAWDFILFATTRDAEAKKFLEITKRPAALKTLIAAQSEDEELHAASTQTLTARNWYIGKDALTVDAALKTMLDQLTNSMTDKEDEQIIGTAIQKINQTL
ncbi:MAG: extracellular solute-binding protein [Candidatus Buchananbacteria bacterium]|nr:extracellular solute-binding protein [Candidatus Buchananbacteria bacterium]